MEKKKYIPRTLSAKVAEMTRSFPCVMVTGARQVGKSTMVATCRCIEYCAGDAAAGKRECEFPDF